MRYDSRVNVQSDSVRFGEPFEVNASACYIEDSLTPKRVLSRQINMKATANACTNAT